MTAAPARGLLVPDPTAFTWRQWLLLAAAAAFVASYLGYFSWARVEEALHRLAAQPAAGRAFADVETARQEALFVVFAFLLLTPPAGLVGLFLAVFAVTLVAWALGPLLSVLRVPVAAQALLTWAIVLGVGWSTREAWTPWVVQAGAFVARAYVLLTGAA